MNQLDQSPVSDDRLLRSPVRRRFIWRWPGCLLAAFIGVVALVLVFYGQENWRGRRAWNKYRQELEARGEQLDFKAFIPKAVPDEENFAATSFVQSWFPKGGTAYAEDNYAQASAKVVLAYRDKDKGHRQFVDLVPWAAAFDAIQAGNLKSKQQFTSDRFDPESQAKAAPAVIESLNVNEAVFAELRAASQRPHSRYPVVYDLGNPFGVLLPHLAKIKATCQRLQLRACAELAAGQTTNALEDVKLLLYVTDSLKEEPFLISYLVRIACLQIALQPIWEGLAEHRWSDAQLQELQPRLQQYDLVADLRRPIGAEQAAGILTADLVRKKGPAYLDSLRSDGSGNPMSRATANLIGRIVPGGWYDQEQLNYCRLFHVQLGNAVRTDRRRVSPGETKSAAREFEQAMGGSSFGAILHHRVIARMLLPALGNVPRKSATAQITTDQAALACALERYRLANGKFPDQIEALTPRFIAKLPDDVLTGAPYKYHRTEDGQFVLYSVGWDEKDDGGLPGSTLFDEKQGDWVWSYPSK